MRFLLFPTAAVLAGASPEQVTDVPLYCRLLQVGLEDAELQPVLEDVKVSTVAHIPLFGDIDAVTTHVEVGAVRTRHCAASVDDQGVFNVGIRELGVEIPRMDWQYFQRDWPQVQDVGSATANTTVSFNVSIDMNREVREVFALNLGQVDLQLGAQRHTWVSKAIEEFTSFGRPLVSGAVQFLAKKALDNNLEIVQRKGGCAFLEHALEALDMLQFAFISYEPLSTHVPALGDVNISVNSTSIIPPSTMQCQHVGFNGTTLTAHIEGVSFSAGFNWSYQKVGSSFWHNEGSALTNVTAGTLLHINLMEPKETRIQLDVPTLKLKLHADADDWMYEALGAVMVPLVRESLQLFGGRVLSREVASCLADPDCPNFHAVHVDPFGSTGTTSTTSTTNTTGTTTSTTVDPASIVVV